MTLNDYCIGMFILFQNIKLETKPTLKVQPLIDFAVSDVIINYCDSSLGIRHSTPGVKPQSLVNSLWDKGSRPKNVGKVMTNFGPWEFIFRWLFALPFMGFKPLNSTKIYLAESEHYTIVHNIRMLTDWTRCTNFRFGLLFFLKQPACILPAVWDVKDH